MKRRFLAWLLCTVMLFNNALPVFATETTEHVHSEECTLGTPVTTDTGDEDDTTDPVNQPDQTLNQPEKGNNGVEKCSNCNMPIKNCKCCPDCKQVECTCECDCGLKKGHDGECQPYCTCGTDPHTEGCKLYVAPEKPSCLEGCTDDSHAEGCPNAPKVETTTCPNCEATYNVGGEHSCNCADCAEPWTAEHTCPTCKFCGVNMFGENIVHAEDCHTFCKCNAEFGTAHADGYNCPLFTDHPFCDCEYFRNEQGTLTHADGCIKNYTCTVCQNKGHKEENCPECPLCINVEGATEHKGEKCKLYCDTCSAIVPEGAAHIDTCYKDKTCEVCGAVGKHLTVNCPECPACKEVSGNHDFNKKCKFANPVSAKVYTFIDGIHVPVSDDVIDVEKYNGQTIFIEKSDVAQNVYFERINWVLGTYGAYYSVDKEKYAIVSDRSGEANLGTYTNATVTIAADVPVDTTIVLTANHALNWGKETVTIHVVDELITKKPENNINTTIEGTNTTINIGGNVPTDVTIVASVVESYHEDILEYIESEDEILFAYDITPVDADGNPWQPQDGEAVTVTLDVNAEDGKYIQILHVHNDETIEEIGPCLVENGKITFTVSKFSTFYGSFVDLSSGVGNSIMLTPGKAEPLEDILEAIDPSIYGKYDTNKVSSVTVSPADCGITANKSNVTASTAFGYDKATLTVVYDGTTYTIRVLRGEAIFALKGTDWNEATTTTKSVKAQGTEITKDVAAFDSTIYVECNEYPADNNDILFEKNYKIYMRPGMAVTLSHGIHLYTDTDNPTYFPGMTDDGMDAYEDFDAFTWMWESPVNYIIANENVSEYTVARFQIRNGADETDDRIRYIELHIIPYNAPKLLKDYLKDNVNDVTKNYSIKEVPATLFNYDGLEWNKHYSNEIKKIKENATTNDYTYFAFVNSGGGKSTNPELYAYKTESNEANSGGAANQGLLLPELNKVTGLPVMAQANQVDLFSTDNIPGSSGEPDAKKAYPDVGFEFIYDEHTGYYSYNSELNHAQYNETNNKIELYTQSLSPSDSNTITMNWADQNPKAGFYPFADINKAFISRDAMGYSVEDKLGMLKNEVVVDNRLNSDLVKDFVSSNSEGSTVDLYFGVHLESEFYLPKDKKLNGQKMIYEFTGDDDLWVFIDGQLVLDVGGGHTPVSGSFNLTDGTVWVERFVQLDTSAGGCHTKSDGTIHTISDNSDLALANDGYFQNEENFLKSLKDDQMHTISIFYLERFAGESNCRMRFNLPLVPENRVEVSKKLLSDDNNQPLSVTPDEEYTFQIFKAEDDDDAINVGSIPVWAGAEYNSGTKTTDAEGKFTLKANEKAIFELPRFTEVYVVELAPGTDYIYDKTSVVVNDKITSSTNIFDKREVIDNYVYESATPIKVVQEKDPMTFDFTNYMKTQPLTIEKEMVGGANGIVDPNHNFNFNLAFTQDCQEISSIATTGDVTSITVNDGESENANLFYPSGTFTLQQGQSVTIPRVPVNMTYTLSESDPDANKSDHITFDKPQFKVNNADTVVKSFKADGVAEADYLFGGTIGNEAHNVKVTNLQRFALKITKSITGGTNPDQSFIFDIKGKDHVSEIKNTVVIPYEKFASGSASVLITGLPVGQYEVTEDSEWSWRYSIEDGDTITKVSDKPIVNTIEPEVPFTNKRTNSYWMDGEAWCKNVFGKDVDWVNNPLGDVKKTEDDE